MRKEDGGKVALDSKARDRQSLQGGGEQRRAHNVSERRQGLEERWGISILSKHKGKFGDHQTGEGQELTCGFVRSLRLLSK